MFRALMLATTIFAAALAAAPAHAQVTHDQATALETQLRTWVAGLFGPKINNTAIPIHIVPDGDHYRLEQPLTNTFGDISITAAPLTAAIRPLDGGRWSVDDLLLPTPFSAKLAGAKPGLSGDFTQTVDTQQMHADIDPSLATPSTYDMTMSGVKQTIHTATGTQTTTIAKLTGHGVMTPKGGQQVSLQSEGTAEGYATSQPTPTGKPLTVAIDRLHATAGFDQFDFARMGEVLHTIAALGALGEKDSPAAKALGHQLVTAATALLAGADGTETLEGMHIDANGHAGSVKQFTLGSGFSAPGGKAEWRLKLAMDGFDSPDIPPGPYRDYLPRHIDISPRISGISKVALVQMVQDAIDDGGANKPDPMTVVMNVLNDGPVTLSLDGLDLDLGPAMLTGTGAFTLASLAEMSGHADIHVTGLDELIRRVNTTPALKQAAPVLVFLKGIGQQNGKDTRWAIKFVDNKLTVNDTDMSSMIPGMGGPPAH